MRPEESGERARHAIFTALPSRSPCVNHNMNVGWCNLRPFRHVSLDFAWSWWLTQTCEVRGCDGEEGELRWSYHRLNKETLWALSFRCLLSNQQSQTFLMPRWPYVKILWSLKYCFVSCDRWWKLLNLMSFTWNLIVELLTFTIQRRKWNF